MRVVILYNQPVLRPDHPEYDSEEWVKTTVEDVAQRLRSTGCPVCELGITPATVSLAEELRACEADVVFNLFEGFANQPESEIAVACELERLHIPFTGSSSQSLWLALNKHLAKERLRAAGVPVPDWMVADSPLVPAHRFEWPAIVKPARRDSSEGIEQASVVTESAALNDRVAHVLHNYGPPVLIEQFLSGREFTISLVENPNLRPLPISEIDYFTMPPNRWPLLSYAAKWKPGSVDYEGSDVIKDTPINESLRFELVKLAVSAFQVLGCRDYARVDVRLNASQRPLVLEVNPNPDLSPSACFAKAMEMVGLDRTRFLLDLILRAMTRAHRASAEPVGS